MKFLNGIMIFFAKTFKFALNLFHICFFALLATFFLTVFFPDKVVNAIEIFKNLLKIP